MEVDELASSPAAGRHQADSDEETSADRGSPGLPISNVRSEPLQREFLSREVDSPDVASLSRAVSPTTVKEPVEAPTASTEVPMVFDAPIEDIPIPRDVSQWHNVLPS